MIFIYIFLAIFIIVGIALTILIIIASLNNSKQKKIEMKLLEKEFIEKYGRKPDYL